MVYRMVDIFFFFSSRRRHTRYWRDWSSDVCSSDLGRARSERAVNEALERGDADAQGIDFERGELFALAAKLFDRRLEAQPLGDTHRQPIRGQQFAVEFQRVVAGDGVVDRRDAVAPRLGERKLQRAQLLLARGRGHDAPDE